MLVFGVTLHDETSSALLNPVDVQLAMNFLVLIVGDSRETNELNKHCRLFVFVTFKTLLVVHQ